MADRFIFSLRSSTKVFAKLGFMAAMLILFMSLFRLNTYFLLVYHETADAVFVEVAQSFLAGFRFDLLVMGFLFIPIYFLVLLQASVVKWPRFMYVSYKSYFILAWLLICFLNFLDYFHFAQAGRRMRFQDYMSWTPSAFSQQIQGVLPYQFWIFCVVTGLLLFLGLSLIRGLQFGDWRDEYSPKKGGKSEIFLRFLVPLLVISFAARGTIEPHHLRYEDSQVSNFTRINEMALNAVWCFDK